MNSKLLFFDTDNDVTLSVMISSIDIVERKGGRPFYCYSQLHYTVESDFFSFHAIQPAIRPTMHSFSMNYHRNEVEKSMCLNDLQSCTGWRFNSPERVTHAR